MKSLRDLLLNHPVPGIREAETRKICADTLTLVSGVQVLPKQIRYEDGRLTLSVPPVLKSALLLKREEISRRLAENGLHLAEIR